MKGSSGMNIKQKYEEELSRLRDEKTLLISELRPIQQSINAIDLAIDVVQEKLAEASKKTRVSDHAVIRYLERIYGFDFEKQRQELLTPVVLQAMEIGATKVKADGYSLVIKGKTVVTVTD